MPSNSNNIRLSSIPNAHSSNSRLRLPSAAPEPSPLSASSFGSEVEDYIGSGTDTVGGRTPVIDHRLSFQDDADRWHPSNSKTVSFDIDDSDNGDEDHPNDMSGGTRPSFMRPSDGRSGTPLLTKSDQDRSRSPHNHSRKSSLNSSDYDPTSSAPPSRPTFSRRSTMRSRSPDTQARLAARKKYTYAAIFLLISLFSFCIQTELGRYVQHELGWNKAYCMLYFTHGSWALLWPAQLAILRAQSWNVPWDTFWRRHVYVLRSTAHMTAAQELRVPRHMMQGSPLGWLLRTTAFVTTTLTIAGLSWYVAVSMTSASDLTAIYNCSAFFAYVFSVPLLREKLRLDKSIAVLIAVAGVLIVAYGDSKEPAVEGGDETEDKDAGSRFLGNMIIGAGSVLYGLYEVLYKKWACPPEGTSPSRGMIFANAFGSCIGLFTLCVLWIPLPILHMLGWETFELPHGKAAFYLFISVIMNATFAGSFLVLISLTSPVLSSVAALLTIFIVAVADWLITGDSMSFAAITGGCMIIVAFLMLSWSTWREMTEESSHGTAAATGEGYGEVVNYSSEDDDSHQGDGDEELRR
ncbi:hypothetical protein F5Y15DRAFT_198801 [Xylariaceae sp. FL0016]|nr:hypothetical protein F5Y15DRAFT_198801 [Xylariaceae sp. FL0016]